MAGHSLESAGAIHIVANKAKPDIQRQHRPDRRPGFMSIWITPKAGKHLH
jgi:hypothetical protein